MGEILMHQRKTIDFMGEQVTYYDLAARFNLPLKTISKRYIKGCRGDALVRPVCKAPHHRSLSETSELKLVRIRHWGFAETRL